MPIESAADRASFLDPDEFGETATYTTAAGAESAIDGIYDAPHQAAEFSDVVAFSSIAPAFKCRTEDLPAADPGQGDRLTVAAGEFLIADSEPDGQGMTRLILTAS